jgi:hypothetical protein
VLDDRRTLLPCVVDVEGVALVRSATAGCWYLSAPGRFWDFSFRAFGVCCGSVRHSSSSLSEEISMTGGPRFRERFWAGEGDVSSSSSSLPDEI